MANQLRSGWTLALASVLAVALLPGCFGKEADPQEPFSATPGPSATATATGNANPVKPPAEVPQNVTFTDCVGWTVFLNYLAPLGPGNRPSSWGPGQPGPVAVGLLAYKCNRFSLGQFERPVQMVFEFTGNADYPDQCTEGQNGPTHLKVLNSLVIDDAELGAYLNETYGIPVWLASFEEDQNDLGAYGSHTWTWTIGSTPPSTVTILDNKDTGPESSRYDRFFWARGAGLVVLDLSKDAQGPAIQQFGNGTLNPPMLIAAETGGTFGGHGEWFPSLEVEGVFTFYKDQDCSEPVS